MPSITSLEQQGRALLADMKKLVEHDSRPWYLKSAQFERIQSDLDSVMKQHAALKGINQGFGTLGDGNAHGGQRLGLRDAGLQGHRLAGPPSLALDLDEGQRLYEAAKSGQNLRLTTKASTETSTQFASPPQYIPGALTQLREPTRVAALFPNVAASSSTIDYYQLTGAAAAATVAEGALKPQSDVSATLKTVRATKIATWVAVTQEVMRDFPSFLSILEDDLVHAIISAESDQLLNGNGTAPNMQGLLGTSGLLTQTVTAGTQPMDALSTAISTLRTGASYTEPDAMVLNPVDLAKVRVVKDSQGRYIAGNPFEAGTTSVWGINVVTTTAMPAGTAVVGNFSAGGVVYVRDGVEILTDAYSQLTNNVVRVVAEERLSLAVTRPTNFVKLTGLNS